VVGGCVKQLKSMVGSNLVPSVLQILPYEDLSALIHHCLNMLEFCFVIKCVLGDWNSSEHTEIGSHELRAYSVQPAQDVITLAV